MKQSKSSQADRFRETARQLGADESDDALDRAMGKLDLRRKPGEGEPKRQEKDESDEG